MEPTIRQAIIDRKTLDDAPRLVQWAKDKGLITAPDPVPEVAPEVLQRRLQSLYTARERRRTKAGITAPELISLPHAVQVPESTL